VHAELRVNRQGASVIEVAARSIGGLCSRTLRFGTGLSLEELILRHALGMRISSLERERRAAGVMMIPIPLAGVLKEVRGQAESRSVSGIEEIAITAHPGEDLVPLPEGARYLGFIFARAESPSASRLRFERPIAGSSSSCREQSGCVRPLRQLFMKRLDPRWGGLGPSGASG
jgi:hypothetical protein